MGGVSDTIGAVLGILLLLATIALVLGRGGASAVPPKEKWRLALIWAAIFVVATLVVGAVL